MFPAMWAAMLGVVALLAEPRIAPSVLGYLAAFLAATAMPSHRLYMISAGNAMLTINAIAWYRLKCRLARRPQSSSDAARS